MNATAANIEALKQYAQVDAHTGIADASPHRLIQMLINGALTKISSAKGHIKTNSIAQKGEDIGMAVSIIGGLRDSLDHNQGGPLADNLDSLYEYMTHRLVDANLHDDISILDEVHGLLMEIKMAWDAIASHPQVTGKTNIEPAA